MRISILTLLVLVSSGSAFAVEPMDYYALARSQAVKEQKNLCIWVRSDMSEGVIEKVDPNTICVHLRKFEGCEDGDAVYAEYRADFGGWHEWVKTMNKNGKVKFQASERKSIPTTSTQQSSSSGDCSTGNCAPSSSPVSRFGFRRGR